MVIYCIKWLLFNLKGTGVEVKSFGRKIITTHFCAIGSAKVDLSSVGDSGLSSSISSTDSESTRSQKNEVPSTTEKNSENVISKKVFKPRLSKNAEQIEALLRRINEENKKTKEVLDNISKSGELQTGSNNFSHRSQKLVDPQDLIDPEEDEKTKNLVNAVIPPIRTAIIEKTSTTFLGMPL